MWGRVSRPPLGRALNEPPPSPGVDGDEYKTHCRYPDGAVMRSRDSNGTERLQSENANAPP